MPYESPAGTSSRRTFLAAAALGCGAAAARSSLAFDKESRPAQIAITLDLEMSAEYPRRGMTEWNFEKGNLDEATKQYALKAARMVKGYGGVIHFFCVARVLEQPNIDWLKELAAEGHPIGNHTYDHVYLLAATPEEIQFRFRRAPWLVEGMSVGEVLDRNIRLASRALQQRAGITARGFRTPGGFAEGLAGRADLQRMLLDCGFTWVSSKYPRHLNSKPGEAPSDEVFALIVEAQKQSQPFIYPSGLVEIPMSPISDVGAFRTARWKREQFLIAIERAVRWAIEQGAVFDFLAHPSCLVIEDPECESLRRICELVREAGDRAKIVDLDLIAKQVNS